jgi:hypothetical protein
LERIVVPLNDCNSEINTKISICCSNFSVVIITWLVFYCRMF